LVSVILPVRNAAGTLDRQLGCLAGQHHAGPWEVIVVDNGSTDASAAVARRWADRVPGLQIIDAPVRAGISSARNAGAAVAGGDLLVFCDADDEVAAGWLTALVDAARGMDMVGGYVDEVSLNDPGRRVSRPPANFGDGLPVLNDFLPYASGGNCGIWATVLDSVGGWNERYSRANDVELSWRVQLSGYRLGLARDAVTRYRHRSSLRELARQFYGWGRADAQLYRDFRARGLPRSSVRDAMLGWARLAKHLLDLLRPGARRGGWLVTAARRSGRLGGCLRWRVLYL
jgi:glycosyltransferase involved in cell wall biosynthesis